MGERVWEQGEKERRMGWNLAESQIGISRERILSLYRSNTSGGNCYEGRSFLNSILINNGISSQRHNSRQNVRRPTVDDEAKCQAAIEMVKNRGRNETESTCEAQMGEQLKNQVWKLELPGAQTPVNELIRVSLKYSFQQPKQPPQKN